MSGSSQGPAARTTGWTGTDRAILLTWAGAIIAVAVACNQLFLTRSNVPSATTAVALGVLLLALPVGAGLAVRLAVRRRSGIAGSALIAAIGAACIAMALYAQWVAYPQTCAPTPGTDCDTGYSLGALLVFGICYVPFFVGAVIGRALLAWSDRRRGQLG